MGKRKENSTNSLNEVYITSECDLTYSICKIGGRWKLLILSKLETGKLRFSELSNQIVAITDRMLALHLKELEREGLIKRTVYAEVPPRVDYELTEIAQELVPIWEQLRKWGKKHKLIILEV